VKLAQSFERTIKIACGLYGLFLIVFAFNHLEICSLFAEQLVEILRNTNFSLQLPSRSYFYLFINSLKQAVIYILALIFLLVLYKNSKKILLELPPLSLYFYVFLITAVSGGGYLVFRLLGWIETAVASGIYLKTMVYAYASIGGPLAMARSYIWEKQGKMTIMREVLMVVYAAAYVYIIFNVETHNRLGLVVLGQGFTEFLLGLLLVPILLYSGIKIRWPENKWIQWI